MTITEANSVVDIIESIWPMTAKDKWGWNTETREEFCGRLRGLDISTDQVRAILRERSMRADKPAPPAEVLLLLTELDRAGKRNGPATDSGLIATLRRAWSAKDPAWKDRNDAEVLWGYAHCRVMNRSDPSSPVDRNAQALAFEFEARCLGWPWETTRGVLFELGCADAVAEIEARDEGFAHSHALRRQAKAAVIAAGGERA